MGRLARASYCKRVSFIPPRAEGCLDTRLRCKGYTYPSCLSGKQEVVVME